MNKERAFRELYRLSKLRDDYLDTVPSDLYPTVIDNKYVNIVVHERDMLLRLVFGDQAESVEWFLYEWKPGYDVGCDGVELRPINNIDEYIEYLREHEGFGYE